MSVKLSEFKTYQGTERTGIGTNSTDTTGGDCFVLKTNEFVLKATAGSAIDGVSITQKAYASDNQTVAKAPLNYMPLDTDSLYDVTITGGTITIVDEGKYYDLSDSVTVDGTTENTTTGQLRLVKFVSATNSQFRIANA